MSEHFPELIVCSIAVFNLGDMDPQGVRELGWGKKITIFFYLPVTEI